MFSLIRQVLSKITNRVQLYVMLRFTMDMEWN